MNILVQLAFMIEIQPAFYDDVHELLMEDVLKPYQHHPFRLVLPKWMPEEVVEKWRQAGYETWTENEVISNVITFEEQVLAGWEATKELSNLYIKKDKMKDVMIVSPQVYNEFMESEDV